MKRAVILLLAIGGLWLIATSLVHVIPPHEMSMTAIGESFYRIHLYAKANNKLPEVIADFPRREGYMNSTTDGWGNELIYEISDAGIVTLTSLGADNKEGGLGDDADLS